jgi:hypothetical protein
MLGRFLTSLLDFGQSLAVTGNFSKRAAFRLKTGIVGLIANAIPVIDK